jgi:hypothetical protein
VGPFQLSDEAGTPLIRATQKRRVANRVHLNTCHREEPRPRPRATLADADELLPRSSDLTGTKTGETPCSRPWRGHKWSRMNIELGVNCLKPDKRFPPEPSDKTRSERNVDGIERVTDRHEEVEPNLCPRRNEHRSPAASSSDELGTKVCRRGPVDRRNGLRTPEYHSWPIGVTKGCKAARRLRDDDEIARRQATLDNREPRTSSSGSALAQIPTAIPKEGAT